MRALATIMVASGLVAAAVLTPAASAVRYTVELCNRTADGSQLEFGTQAGTTGLVNDVSCGTGPASGIRQQLPAGTTGSGAAFWALRAPAGTTIARVDGLQEMTATWPTPLVWEARNLTTQLERFGAAQPAHQIELDVNSPFFISRLRCEPSACQGGQFPASTRFTNVVATIDDLVPPQAAVTPSPATAGPVRGLVEIPFTASDQGSGLRSAALLVDGVQTDFRLDPNGGSCTLPFQRLVPCKLQMDSSLQLDTSALSNGAHQVVVRVADASVQEVDSPAVTITVDNSPLPLPDPAPGPGPPTPGPPAPVPPTPGPPDQGQRPPAGTAAPTLGALSITPKGLKPGKRGLLRCTGSGAGTLSVTIAPVGKGAARRKVARPLATVTAVVAAGPAAVPIRTRLKGKALLPGPYRLTATLRTADGRASAPATLRFKVLTR